MHLPDFLIDRYKDWKQNNFPKKKNLYKKLVDKGQKPKAMIISCCDSRVDPNLIFKANEGDFFIHRNIANLVPDFKNDLINYETLSAVEYGILTLGIKNLIILGHSCCGGIDYANKYFSKNISSDNTFVTKWIQNIKPAYELMNKSDQLKKNASSLEKLSLVNSLKNLEKFPKINNLIKSNKLKAYGIWFDIESGSLMIYNKINKKFEKIL